VILEFTGVGFGGKGFLSTAGSFEEYGEAFGPGDVIGSYINLPEDGGVSTVSFSKNGKLFASRPLPSHVKGAVLFPAILLQGGPGGGASLTANFGSLPFIHPPQTPYIALTESPELFDQSSRETYLTSASHRDPLAVIVEPTLEMTKQTFDCIADLCCKLPQPTIQVQLLGSGNKRSRDAVEDVDILVGTMGKLQNSAASGEVSLSQVRLFILDEADKLISNHSMGSILELFAQCPGGGTGQHRLQAPLCSYKLFIMTL